MDANENKIGNPYKPYSVINHIGFRFTITDDDSNTSITIDTKMEECRFGTSAKDIILMKEADNKLGEKTYTNHILDFVRRNLFVEDIKDLEIYTIDTPVVKLMNDDEIDDWVDRCVDD